MLRSYGPAMLLAGALLVFAGNGFAQARANADFAPSASLTGYPHPLRLAGQAVFDHRFVPYYTAALYVPTTLRTAANAADALTPYRVDLVWLTPGLSAEEARDYWREVLHTAAGDDYGRIQPRVEQFIDLIPAVVHGDRYTFEYLPDAGLKFGVNGKPRGQLAGVEFNRALIAVWIGPRANAAARAALLGRPPDSAASQHQAVSH